MNLVNNFTAYSAEIHFNTFLPSTPRSLKWSLPTKILYKFLIFLMCVTCSHHLIFHGFITVKFGVQKNADKDSSSSLCDRGGKRDGFLGTTYSMEKEHKI
jgi:hypothetical protein